MKFQNSTKDNFDVFELSEGVKLSQENKIKFGKIRTENSKMNLANLTSLMNDSNAKIRLTKNEYFSLTRLGNLSRSTLNQHKEFRENLSTSNNDDDNKNLLGIDFDNFNLSKINNTKVKNMRFFI